MNTRDSANLKPALPAERDAEEWLRERERALAAIFEQAADGLVLIDIECQRFAEFNDAACTGLGYTRDEFSQLKLGDLQAVMTPDQVAERLAGLVTAGRGSFEVRHRCKDGGIRDVWASNRLIRLQDRSMIVAVWHDITEQKRVLSYLGQSEQRFRDFASATADWWFWEMDADLRFNYFSENAAVAIGRPTAAMIGKRRQELFGTRERAEQQKWSDHLADLEARRPFRQFEYCFDTNNAGERWVSISGVPIFAEDGRFLGYRGTGNNITARKQAELAYQESQRILRTAIDAIDEGFVLYDKEDRLVLCNEKYRQIYAASADLIVPGASFEQIIRVGAERGQYKDAIGRVDEWVAERMAAHLASNSVVEQRLDNGRWLRIVEQKTTDGYIVGFRVDITSLKRTELALRESEARFRAIFESAGDAFLILRDGIFADCNSKSLELFAGERADIIGRSPASLSPELQPDGRLSREKAAEQMQAVLRFGSQVFEWRHRTLAGMAFDVEVSLSAVKLSNETLLLASLRDVTGRKQLQEQLRRSELKYRLLAENSTEWIHWTSPSGVSIYHSPACQEITGYGSQDFIDDPALLKAIVHAEDRELYEGHLRQGDVRQELNFRIIRRDGELRWIGHVCQPLLDDDGTVLGRRSTNRDVTDSKRIDAELDRHRHHLEELVSERTAQLEAANRAKSTFLANMSHEIRTPMNAIVGLTHLIQRRTRDSQQRELLQKVSAAADHLLSVINDILDISKIEAGKVAMEQIDFTLARVLDNAMSMVSDHARDKGLALTLEVAPDLPPVLRGDPLRLGQVLVNLANNAVKYTERGSIVLRVHREDGNKDGVSLRFEVEDTGIGVSQEIRGRLFQAFEQADVSTTRRFGGTGLGLAISKRLAEMMGGTVGVRSEAGRGSTFWFTVHLGLGSSTQPLKTAGGLVDEVAALEQKLASRCHGARLLLVEDNRTNQLVLEELLRNTGLVLDLAGDGAQALAMASRRVYDLVLMDVQMPVMDGLQATRAIRRLAGWSAVPILAVTANAFDEDKERCREAGMNDVLTKPVAPQALFSQLLTWLADAQGGAAPAPAGPTPAAQPKVAENSFDAVGLQERLEAVPGLDVVLGLQSVRNRMATYVRLLGKYVDGHCDDMAAVRRQLAAGNVGEAQRLAHSLKGVSATLGVQEVRAQAAELEMAIKERRTNGEIEALVVDVEKIWSALADELVRVLPSAAGGEVAAATVDARQAAALADELERFLAEDDMRANKLVTSAGPQLRAMLGEDACVLEGQIALFDYELALATLRTARTRWPAVT